MSALVSNQLTNNAAPDLNGDSPDWWCGRRLLGQPLHSNLDFLFGAWGADGTERNRPVWAHCVQKRHRKKPSPRCQRSRARCDMQRAWMQPQCHQGQNSFCWCCSSPRWRITTTWYQPNPQLPVRIFRHDPLLLAVGLKLSPGHDLPPFPRLDDRDVDWCAAALLSDATWLGRGMYLCAGGFNLGCCWILPPGWAPPLRPTGLVRTCADDGSWSIQSWHFQARETTSKPWWHGCPQACSSSLAASFQSASTRFMERWDPRICAFAFVKACHPSFGYSFGSGQECCQLPKDCCFLACRLPWLWRKRGPLAVNFPDLNLDALDEFQNSPTRASFEPWLQLRSCGMPSNLGLYDPELYRPCDVAPYARLLLSTCKVKCVPASDTSNVCWSRSWSRPWSNSTWLRWWWSLPLRRCFDVWAGRQPRQPQLQAQGRQQESQKALCNACCCGWWCFPPNPVWIRWCSTQTSLWKNVNEAALCRTNAADP